MVCKTLTMKTWRLTARTVAEKLANRLNARLNYQPSLAPESGTGEEEASPESVSTHPKLVKRYEEELEINDFPQQVRWKITSKEAISMIGDYSEAGITVRGQYYPPGALEIQFPEIQF